MMEGSRGFVQILMLLLYFSEVEGKGSEVSISISPSTVSVGGSVTFTCSYPTVFDAQSLLWLNSNDILYAKIGSQKDDIIPSNLQMSNLQLLYYSKYAL